MGTLSCLEKLWVLNFGKVKGEISRFQWDNLVSQCQKAWKGVHFNVSQNLSLLSQTFYETKSGSTTKRRVDRFEGRKASYEKKVTAIVGRFFT